MPKIAILDDYYNRARNFADWANADVADFVFFDKAMTSETEVIKSLKGFDAVGLMRERTPFPESVISPVSYTHLTLPTNREV